MSKNKVFKTKYYGIQVEQEDNYWYLFEDSNGDDQWFDHYPTEQEIEAFKTAVTR